MSKQKEPAVVSDVTENWNMFISSVVSAAVTQGANYVDLARRPSFIQTVETLHLRFSRHQLAHSSSFLTLFELLCPPDPNAGGYRVDEWLELTVCLHSLLSPDEIEYLNWRIVEALSVYFMEHPNDLLISVHGDFMVDREMFTEWVGKVPWYRTACAIVLFWLPNDFQEVTQALRAAVTAARGE